MVLTRFLAQRQNVYHHQGQQWLDCLANFQNHTEIGTPRCFSILRAVASLPFRQSTARYRFDCAVQFSLVKTANSQLQLLFPTKPERL